jgi:hypothetical protein
MEIDTMSIMIKNTDETDTDYSKYTDEQLLHKLEHYNSILKTGFIGNFYGSIVEDKLRIEEELSKREQIEEFVMDSEDDD